MTRSEAIQCYCQQVEHWIDLPKKRRRELLDGLRRELEALGAEYLAISNVDEARELRLAGVGLPILQLGMTPADQTAALLENRVTQAVWSEAAGEAFSREAERAGGRLRVHLKLDTGMSRLGVQCDGGGSKSG